jgi:hypothetical protein
LLHFDELSKRRPSVDRAEIWIGQQKASYGLLVTPRFRSGQWENDKSEIRAFDKPYWTIAHVLETGFVIPGKDRVMEFSTVDQYLQFFQDVLVRQAGSTYQDAIAEYYCDFVRDAPKPEDVPLLLPEFRYGGLEKKHIYRLDFLIVNPYTLDRIGFEFSPWSTHGYLAKIGGLTQKEINGLAADNFEKEMQRHRAFFKKHDIYCLIFTDTDLKDIRKLFDSEIAPHLEPENPQVQLSFQIMDEFLATSPGAPAA